MLYVRRVGPDDELRGTLAAMNSPSEIGARVREARERRRMSVIELARAVGLSRGALYQIENGTTRSPTPTNLFAIAQATGFSLEWLTTGHGVPETGRPVNAITGDAGASLERIPGLKVETAITGRVHWSLDHANPAEIPHSWLAYYGVTAEELVSYRAQDDAMAPSICRGDYVMINTSQAQPQTGRVYMILLHHELLMRRAQLEVDGTIVFRAENARFEPIRVPPDFMASLSIVGRVQCRWGTVEI